MPGMFLGFPFNEELFNYNWRNEPDVAKTALIESGAVVANTEIASQIAGGSNLFTVPFYKTIGGDPVNYDGQTDISSDETDGASASGIVYGRAKAWTARDFTADFNNGADPMGNIVSQVVRYWAKYRQKQLINILGACFGVSDSADWDNKWSDHVTDISSADATVAAANKLGATTIGDAVQKACGDNQGAFSLAVMHSAVAKNLAGLQLLEFRKYTDASGIERQLNIADVNGLTVVVDDGVPVDTAGSAPKYTTYLLGLGSVNYAAAPVEHASEYDRNPAKNGGQETLYTRIRETILPNGFSYTKKSGDGVSPTDEVLGDKSRYSYVYDPKAIAMAKVVSNG